MKVLSTSFSAVGARAENQDCILEPTEVCGGFLMAIADGLGGRPGGKEAASLAVSTLKQVFDGPEQFPIAFQHMHEAIRSKTLEGGTLQKMATTLTAAFVRGANLFVAHVGDTRAYQLRGKGLLTLTIDQNQARTLQEEGIISARQARRHPSRHVLTSVLSADSVYDLHVRETGVLVGDRLLLCTDGFYETVKKDIIAGISSSLPDFKEFADELSKLSMAALPRDNASALFVQLLK